MRSHWIESYEAPPYYPESIRDFLNYAAEKLGDDSLRPPAEDPVEWFKQQKREAGF